MAPKSSKVKTTAHPKEHKDLTFAKKYLDIPPRLLLLNFLEGLSPAVGGIKLNSIS